MLEFNLIHVSKKSASYIAMIVSLSGWLHGMVEIALKSVCRSDESYDMKWPKYVRKFGCNEVCECSLLLILFGYTVSSLPNDKSMLNISFR